MPLEIRRTIVAQRDLDEIWDYIAIDSPFAATALLRRFQDVLIVLSRGQVLGRPRDDYAPGLRSFPVGRYLMFFDISENSVHLVRVVSGRRKITPRMFIP